MKPHSRSGHPGELGAMSPTYIGKERIGSPWKGLLLMEWRAHNRLMLGALVTWLGLVWILPQYVNPGWILCFGLVYALVAAPSFGGGDVIEGCEEFSFSLPATRKERYLARLVVGGGMLIIFTMLDILSLGLDLSQAIERLYMDTGLVKTSSIVDPQMLYWLVLFLPLATFAFTFAIACNARSRALVFTSWFWGGLITLILLRLSLKYEFSKWESWNGAVASLVLGCATPIVLWISMHKFATKEVVAPSKPIIIPTMWWAWLGLTLGSILAAGFLVNSLSTEFFKMLGKP